MRSKAARTDFSISMLLGKEFFFIQNFLSENQKTTNATANVVQISESVIEKAIEVRYNQIQLILCDDIPSFGRIVKNKGNNQRQ